MHFEPSKGQFSILLVEPRERFFELHAAWQAREGGGGPAYAPEENGAFLVPTVGSMQPGELEALVQGLKPKLLAVELGRFPGAFALARSRAPGADDAALFDRYFDWLIRDGAQPYTSLG